jgi:hypothetical protein
MHKGYYMYVCVISNFFTLTLENLLSVTIFILCDITSSLHQKGLVTKGPNPF